MVLCGMFTMIWLSSTTAEKTRQLLYYPFNPFFVLFGNIIHAPLSDHANHDVQLLRSAVSYYAEMSTQDSSFARKLQGIANVFACLAELYVEDAKTRHSLGTTAATRSHLEGYPGNGSMPISNISMPSLPFSTDGGGGSASTFDFDFFGGSNLLNCFTSLDYTSQLDFSGQQGFAISEDGSYVSLDGGVAPDPMHFSQSSVFESLEKWSTGSKRPLECTFDWFAWDLNQ
jgi:hypothetical protein